MDDFEDDDPQLITDSATLDAADFFSTLLARQFPDLVFERIIPRVWRPGWKITVPANAQYFTEAVTARAEELQDKFYFDEGYLIPFTIERGEEEGG